MEYLDGMYTEYEAKDGEMDPADEADKIFDEIMQKSWYEYFVGLTVAQKNVRERNYGFARRKFQELDRLCSNVMAHPEENDPLDEDWEDMQILARQMDAELDSSDPQSVNTLIDILFGMLMELCRDDLSKLGYFGPIEWDEQPDEKRPGSTEG